MSIEAVIQKKLYEAMFLIDSALATDWDMVISTLETVLKKAGGEIVSMRKWDERKLAYEIDGKARGTYILCYFRADGEKIRDIEKDVQLSERIMRVLILGTEQQKPEDIEKDTPAVKAEKENEEPAKETANDVETAQVDTEKPAEPQESTGDVETAQVDTEKPTEPQETANDVETAQAATEKPAEPQETADDVGAAQVDTEKPVDSQESADESKVNQAQ